MLTMKCIKSFALAAFLLWAGLATGDEPLAIAVPTNRASKAELLRYRQQTLRPALREMLGIPTERCDLQPESRGQFERDGIVVEKWIWTAEPGSRVPCNLYRPKVRTGLMPVIVFTYGHGASKSAWNYNYAAQVYAKAGIACLAIDPIGEEERNLTGRMGSRAHDPQPVHERAERADRLMMGKLVFDTMRAVDYLLTRDDIDRERIGVAGYSLGGAKASWMAALDTRLKLAIVAGWAYHDVTLNTKFCTRVPNTHMRKLCSWEEFAMLSAPHCTVLVTNGDADKVIDQGDSAVWDGTRTVVANAEKLYTELGAPRKISTWFEAGGGHRPYFCYRDVLEVIHRELDTPAMSLDQVRTLPTLNAGRWCDAFNIPLEKLYGTELHWRGSTLPDLHLKPMTREELACLRSDEIGKPEYTLEGWLDMID